MNKLFLILVLTFLILTAYSPQARAEREYDQGAALLEVFKADSLDNIEHLSPALKVPWLHDLVCMAPAKGVNIWLVREGYADAFLVPELAPGLGAKPGSTYSFPYAARITFYYEAKEPGDYKFTIWHGQNTCELIIGDFLVGDLPAAQRTAQGTCKFDKGFNRAVFWLISNINSGPQKNDPYFQISVLAPGASTPVIIKQDTLFTKPTDLPWPWGNRHHH